MDPETLQRITAADLRLVAAAKDVKVLSSLAWPARLLEEFLKHWRSNNPRLPEPPRARPRLDDNADELHAVMADCDLDEPIGRYMYRTAHSYVTAVRMVDRVGTPEFTQRSIELYGAPGDRIAAAALRAGVCAGGRAAAGGEPARHRPAAV